MPSLSEAYRRRRWGREFDRLPALVAGAAAFGLGLSLLLAGIVLVALEPGGRYPARRLAGLLAGFGPPAILVGVVAIIPSRRRARAATGFGTALCGAATIWFYRIYPERWFQIGADDLTLEIALLYTAGAALSLWFVMRAVATFRTRNDPRGTVTLEIEREGETRVVEVDPDEIDTREKLRQRVEEEHAG